MKSKKKLFTIIFAFLIVLMVFVYFVFINTTYFHAVEIKDNGDNNCYNNSYTNTIPRLARARDKLYYNYGYSVLRYGTYEISNDVTKRIYWTGPAVSSTTLDLNNVWDDKILSYDIVNKNVSYYNIDVGQTQNLFEMKSEEFIPESYFVANGEFYYLASNSDLYKTLDNDKVELILSKDSLNCDSYSHIAINDDYLYFITSKKVNNDNVEECLCKYDIKNKKTVDKMLCYKGSQFANGMKRFSCDMAINNKVYGCAINEYSEEPLTDETYVYATDIKSKISKVIFKSDGSTLLNCYNDRLFMCVENGNDKGIYSIDVTSDKVTKIFETDSISGLYIVDSEWIYFVDENDYSLYRVTQKGKNLEKVFG